MPLPTSGPITAAMIRDEFDGTNPVVISDYYRGGSLVPDTPANSGVPTSGTISYSDFYGAAAVVLPEIIIFPNDPFVINIFGDTGGGCSSFGMTFESNGLVNLPSGYTQWHDTPAVGLGSNYWIRFDAATDFGFSSPPSAPVGTWLSLSTSRTWSTTTCIFGEPTSMVGNMFIAQSPSSTPPTAGTPTKLLGELQITATL